MSRVICCGGLFVCLLTLPSLAEDWPQWRGVHRDGVWRETGLVEKFASQELKLRWHVPVGSGYSGPTVAAGRVYLTDRQAEPKQIERIRCFDEQTGRELWTKEYDCVYDKVGYVAGPRACVTVADGRAYALGTMGNLHCLDAKSGEILWKKDLNAEYKIRMPIWGIASAPLVEADLLIVQVGGEKACLVAFDRKTGEERWRALDDNASYSAPIVIEQAGQRVLVCWTGDNLVGLAPASGKVFWKYPTKPTKMVINIGTPVLNGERLFLSCFYDGAYLLRVPADKLAVEEIWKRRGKNEEQTDALQSIISTPVFLGDYLYGVDSYGQLRCLDAKTGDRIWENLTATPKARWSTIHFVRNGDKMWMFNERGELIIGKLSPEGFQEISRAKLISPTQEQLRQRNGVCWSHPAFADRCVFERNDEELVCASLAAGDN
ncbi:MAG TPA: PQQ-binding-like beta-propeller repeat protein [Pirellulales bacterium]|jgi:outer membrane protein assembly factor BamB|nr:PQQ-binding-like beta-propeller repeat protein [Pirellulales bacterium]